jgi:xylonate dehydratase
VRLEGTIDVVNVSAAELNARQPHPALAPNAALPDDTKLWAALQQLSGGTWGGCVYDADAVVDALKGQR